MRILFIDFTLPYLLKDSEYPVGGFAVQLKSWLIGLSSNHDVGVLTFKGARKVSGESQKFELIETYDPAKGVKVLKYFYLFLPQLLVNAYRFKPDVIIQACASLNTGLMAFVAKCLRVPFVYRVANDMDVDGRCNQRLRKYEQYAYYYGLRKADAILCQNKYQYERLREKFPKKSMIIIHNPYDTSKVSRLYVPRQERKYIAWVGVFSKQKNLPLLLKLATEKPGVQFKIAGIPAKNIDQDTKLALEGLEMLPNVEFVGYIKRTDILTFLSGAIALLNTSHYEGFSNTYLESFAAQTPVICPLRNDPDFIVSEFNLGIACKEDMDLVNAIEEVTELSNEEHFLLSERCHKFLLQSFSPKYKASELIRFIKEKMNESVDCC